MKTKGIATLSDETLTDRWIRRLKNNPVVAFVVVAGFCMAAIFAFWNQLPPELRSRAGGWFSDVTRTAQNPSRSSDTANSGADDVRGSAEGARQNTESAPSEQQLSTTGSAARDASEPSIDLTGKWTDHQGVQYDMQQMGEYLSFVARRNGAQIATGKGGIWGRVIHQSYFFPDGSHMECPATLQPSNNVIDGVCQLETVMQKFHIERLK